MEFRDLEKVRVIIKDATGLDVSYAYDDLVFPDHTAFIVQFDDTNPNNFFCYFHEDFDVPDQKTILASLISISSKKGCTMIPKGTFRLKEKKGEVEIHFSS
jgi:hypothetical protein